MATCIVPVFVLVATGGGLRHAHAGVQLVEVLVRGDLWFLGFDFLRLSTKDV